MAQRAHAYRHTVEEYLDLSDSTHHKLEYHRGQIYMMAGGKFNHNAISANVIHELSNALERAGSDCIVLTGDQKVHVPVEDLYTHADGSIVCDEPHFVLGRTDIIDNPVLIVEVLSPSTRDHDLTDKFEYYTRLPSFRHYLLVEQDSVTVEYRWLDADGYWQSRDYTSRNDVIKVAGLEIELQLSVFYRNIRF
jgi:Uma2 family endonuclease